MKRWLKEKRYTLSTSIGNGFSVLVYTDEYLLVLKIQCSQNMYKGNNSNRQIKFCISLAIFGMFNLHLYTHQLECSV